MRVILLSGGSLGDTLPFALVGEHLQKRGHDVTLVATGTHERLAHELGLPFEPSMDAALFSRFMDDQQDVPLMERVRLSAQAINAGIEPSLRAIRKLYRPGQTLLCWQGFMVAGRIAQEELRCPGATVQVYPAGFRSADLGPPFHRWPAFLRRLIIHKVDDVMYAPVKKVVETTRRSLGLTPDRQPLRHWWSSPQVEIGLFPDWFQSVQLDWPRPTVLTGFPIAPRDPSRTLPADLDSFLADKKPTLTFAPSSLTRATKSFFDQSMKLTQLLDAQAVFLTPQRDLLPDPLPSFARVYSFLPLDKLLPRCQAIIHQGGIGTIAQALRAGVPQITTPVAYDQPDNAFRLHRLGVSIDVPPKDYLARTLALRLQAFLSQSALAARCRDLAERVDAARPFTVWADTLEQTFAGSPLTHLQGRSE